MSNLRTTSVISKILHELVSTIFHLFVLFVVSAITGTLSYFAVIPTGNGSDDYAIGMGIALGFFLVLTQCALLDLIFTVLTRLIWKRAPQRWGISLILALISAIVIGLYIGDLIGSELK